MDWEKNAIVPFSMSIFPISTIYWICIRLVPNYVQFQNLISYCPNADKYFVTFDCSEKFAD